MIRHLKKPHLALIVLLAVFLVLYIFWYSADAIVKEEALVRPYEPGRDFNHLINIMNQNLFLLSERKEFSPEKILIDRAPYDNPKRKGEALIDVIEFMGDAVGFIAYFKESAQEGHIWLLAVSKDFRGLGFGSRLIKAAIKTLKEKNSSYITISTRRMNTPALHLYKSFGFIEQSTSQSGIVNLILKNP